MSRGLVVNPHSVKGGIDRESLERFKGVAHCRRDIPYIIIVQTRANSEILLCMCLLFWLKSESFKTS